ncbi:MAG: glutathione peroxidase [Marinifilaceae bacterium]|jgi:glutathione peroxidase|nr:glutathione peroxidase [Marinifilaceae bacterium]
MKNLILCLAIMLTILSCQQKKNNQNKIDLKQYDLELITGETVNLDKYKNKTILIVNTASKCGLTPQYEGLQKLHKKYHNKGLVILAFPCDQFAGQEPGSNDEIANFCQANYNTEFPLFKKTEVIGENAHPLFKTLTGMLKFNGFDDSEMGKKFDNFVSKKFPDIYNRKEIMWNFTKFIIDKNSNLIKRFEPNIKPEEMEDYIVSIL